MKSLYDPAKGSMRVAGFMSGTGSNLKKLIERQRGYEIVLIFTDTKDEAHCNAKKIGAEHGIKVEVRDIRDYCAERNAKRSDMNVREEYDAETAALLEQHRIDLVALCGYMSIVTAPIIGTVTTINVHPADLRVKENGKRVYAGCMGLGCIRKAVDRGDAELRSTVHLVTEGVDEGAVLGVSPPVTVEEGVSAEELHEELKNRGDWAVYPKVMELIAAGRFALENGAVFFDGEEVPDGIAVE